MDGTAKAGRLAGKVAMVVGAGSSGPGWGNGKATAVLFAREGAKVFCVDINPAAAEETVGIIRGEGGTAQACRADVAKAADVEAMVQRCLEVFGRIDVLVNNAAVRPDGDFLTVDEEEWHRVQNINFYSVFHLTRACVPGMIEKGWGRVINIASAHGLVASVNKSAYVAAKHGIVGLTKVTALETGGSGVTCNAICPGWVLTPLVKKQIEARAAASGKSYEEEKLALVAEKTPSKDFSTPAQIGGLAVFLCSASADQITGAPLSIDGGWMAQ